MASNEINTNTSMNPKIYPVSALPIESKLAFINAIINGYITGKLKIAIRLKLCPDRQAIAATSVSIEAKPSAANAMMTRKFGTFVTGVPNNNQKAA